VRDEDGRLDVAGVLEVLAVEPELVDVAVLVAVAGVEPRARRGAQRPPILVGDGRARKLG
jgi:hypothetical protein